MALYGYVRKTRPAPWTLKRPKSTQDAPKFKKRVQTRLTRKSLLKRNLVRFRRIPVMSPIRRLQLRQYAIEARAFVKEAARKGICPVFVHFKELIPEMQMFLTQPWGDYKRRSCKIAECHHLRGRTGILLMDKRYWIAVSKWGHRAIHAFPNEARRFGWLCERGFWNRCGK